MQEYRFRKTRISLFSYRLTIATAFLLIGIANIVMYFRFYDLLVIGDPVLARISLIASIFHIVGALFFLAFLIIIFLTNYQIMNSDRFLIIKNEKIVIPQDFSKDKEIQFDRITDVYLTGFIIQRLTIKYDKKSIFNRIKVYNAFDGSLEVIQMAINSAMNNKEIV